MTSKSPFWAVSWIYTRCWLSYLPNVDGKWWILADYLRFSHYADRLLISGTWSTTVATIRALMSIIHRRWLFAPDGPRFQLELFYGGWCYVVLTPSYAVCSYCLICYYVIKIGMSLPFSVVCCFCNRIHNFVKCCHWQPLFISAVIKILN